MTEPQFAEPRAKEGELPFDFIRIRLPRYLPGLHKWVHRDIPTNQRFVATLIDAHLSLSI
jgi:hypothetical protein